MCGVCVCGERVEVKEPESYLKVVSVTLPSVLSLIRTPLHMNDPPHSPTHLLTMNVQCTGGLSLYPPSLCLIHCALIDRMQMH